VSTCKECALAADIFTENVKQYGFDAASSAAKDHIYWHTKCEYVDCYCQHKIEKGAYVRDK
jgi:hypothetical protein